MLYVATRSGLIVAEAGGRAASGEPRAVERLGDRGPECVAAHPERPETVLCGTFDDGLWRSTDGGERWERVDLGTAVPERITSVAVAAADPNVVYAGTEPTRVFRSTDGGSTWERREGITGLPSSEEWSFPPRPDTHHARWIETAPDDPRALYVGVEAGALVRSPDGGGEWRDRVPSGPLDTHSIATHPATPERGWIAAGDGFHVTDDRGDGWRTVEAGLDRTYCWSTAVGGAERPRVALVSAARGARDAHSRPAETYVYRRRLDDGAAWERLDDRAIPAGEGVIRPVVAVDPTDRERFYLAAEQGVYRSTDAGRSWERLPIAVDHGGTIRGLAVA